MNMTHKLKNNIKRITASVLCAAMCVTGMPVYAGSATDSDATGALKIQSFSMMSEDLARALQKDALDDEGYLAQTDENGAIKISPKVKKKNVSKVDLDVYIMPVEEDMYYEYEDVSDEELFEEYLFEESEGQMIFSDDTEDMEADDRADMDEEVSDVTDDFIFTDEEDFITDDNDERYAFDDEGLTEDEPFVSGVITSYAEDGEDDAEDAYVRDDILSGYDSLSEAQEKIYVISDEDELPKAEDDTDKEALVEDDEDKTAAVREGELISVLNEDDAEGYTFTGDEAVLFVLTNRSKKDAYVRINVDDLTTGVFVIPSGESVAESASDATSSDADVDLYNDGVIILEEDDDETLLIDGFTLSFEDENGHEAKAFVTGLSGILDFNVRVTEGIDDQWYTTDDEPVDVSDMEDEEVYYMYGIEEQVEDEYGIMTLADTGDAWSFDIYYVGTDDPYYVKETDDFTLKYQMEFHTSEDLPAGSVTITIPAALLTYRNGTAVTPDDIAVPMVDYEVYQEACETGDYSGCKYNASMPLNCCYDDEGNLIFFSYRDISAGTNIAWQVLYKNLTAMQIVDMTEWELTAEIEVDVPVYDGNGDPTDEVTKEYDSGTISGLVDTYANLTSVTKTAYNNTSVSYTPGLYTQDQLNSYIDYWMVDSSDYLDHIEDYVYVVWDVKVKGSGSQPYNIEIKDESSAADGTYAGTVIGYQEVSSSGYTQTISEPTLAADGFYTVITDGEQKSWGTEFRVVVAYNSSEVHADVLTENTITVTLIPYDPYDGEDNSQTKSASAVWTYQDYEWHYSTGVIGIEKYVKNYDPDVNKTWVSSTTMPSALEGYLYAYRYNTDFDGIDYYTEGICNNGWMTHYVSGGDHDNMTDDGVSSDKLGEWNHYYNHVTVADDVVYAFPSDSEASEDDMLDYNDYYFSSVKFVRTDTAWDVWEDRSVSGGEHPEGVDQTMTIYAMYKDSNAWEKVTSVDCSSGSSWTYTFTSDELAKQPWRVKAEYNTVSMLNNCKIYVTIALRGDSEKLNGMVFDESGEIKEGLTDLQIENLSAITGIWSATDSYFHSTDGSYQEPGLTDVSHKLYDNLYWSGGDTSAESGTFSLGVTLPMRHNAQATLTDITGQAASYKNVASTDNDPDNNRTLVQYNLTAWDGYLLYDSKLRTELEEMGTQSPGRFNVVFYDLLPTGMHYDASYEPTAGRITSLTSTTYQTQYKSWDKTQVELIDVSTTADWRGTGRTMVEFHIEYTGADPTIFSNDLWAEGWGVHFRAYYNWSDEEAIGKSGNANIAAFMPDVPEGCEIGSDEYNYYMRELCGTAQEVYYDDGTDTNGNALTGDYAPFAGGDLNGDDITNVRNVLYMNDTTSADVAVASESEVEKLVRADANDNDEFGREAHVENGAGYTYHITVKASAQPIKNIFVFDRLEYAWEDREEIEGYNFEDVNWKGTFTGVDTTELELVGIEPVVYYNAARDANLPGIDTTGTGGTVTKDKVDAILSENGWTKADEWGSDVSNVAAVAIDCTTKTDGSDYVLPSMTGISYDIHMQAPDADTVKTTYNGATWAYNNPSFYSTSEGNNTSARVVGDTVRVSIGETAEFRITKEFDGEVPEIWQDTEFEFTITEGGYEDGGFYVPYYFSERDYTVYDEDGNKVKSGATDLYGSLTLKAGQTAVFGNVPVSEIDSIQVTETDSVFWSYDFEIRTEGNVTTYVVKNTFHPVLYIQKLVTGLVDGVDMDQYEFTMKLEYYDEDSGEWLPYVGEYWYVNKVRTDGGEPTALGDGKLTEEDAGVFTIKYGDILAFFMPKTGVQYRITEVNVDGTELTGELVGDDWICKTDTAEGNMAAKGNSDSITNIYRWKNLYLTKEITHQDVEDAIAYGQEFTFKVEQVMADGTTEICVGNKWHAEDADGNTVASGALGENGCFTAAVAGCTVTIEHLEAECEFVVTEVESGTRYIAVNDSVQVEMPLYSTGTKDTITNDWQMRPLTVTKLIAQDENGDTTAADNATFEFILYINGEPFDASKYDYDIKYVITENGSEVQSGVLTTVLATSTFTLKNQQSITFYDIGYLNVDSFAVYEKTDNTFLQVYPSSGTADLDGYGIPNTGEFTLSDGESVSFVNGEDGMLLIEKQYSALNDDAQAYITAMLEDPELRESAAVTISMATDKTASWPVNDVDGIVLIDNWLGGYTEDNVWKALSDFVLPPGVTMVIPFNALSDSLTYTITESAGDQHKVFEWTDGTWLEVSQAYPENDGAAEGTILGETVVTLINNVEALDFESLIAKHMTVGSDEVPEGATLTWRVEMFDGTDWVPAEGVRYLLFDESGCLSDRVLTTGSDGLITITKTENGDPMVQFIDSKVLLNCYGDADEGTYRVVEVLDSSDDSWGSLAGYGTVEDPYGYELNPTTYTPTAFVNSNRATALKIAKETTEDSDDSFSFTLEQVLAYEGTTVTESIPGSGIEYTIYDTETDEEIGTGITTDTGKFTLKAGQYVLFDLPDGTVWTVTESVSASYELTDLTGENGGDDGWKFTKINDRTMLIRQQGESEISLTASIENNVFGQEQEIESGGLTVWVGYSDGTSKQLTNSEYTLSIDGDTAGLTPEKDGTFTVVISYTDDDGTSVSTSIEIIVQTRIEYKGEIVWENDDVSDRPESVELALKADGDTIGTVTVTVDAEGKWLFDFGEFDVYGEDGVTKIEYVIEETGLEETNYEIEYTGFVDGEYIITNTYVEPVHESVRYAVAIYGIQEDTYKLDNGTTGTAGLTFGPATGANYVSSYQAHLTEDEYNQGSNGVCLHWMTWDEIIEQSQTDPTVFEDCLKNGCTHSVSLDLEGKTIKGSPQTVNASGDGYSVLYNSIGSNYRKWNNTDVDEYNYWGASRIRATLNGADNNTQTDAAGTCVDETNSLFAAFPGVLQEAIVPKKVISTTEYSSSSTVTDTTYDKLWLFSYMEFFSSTGTRLSLEGNQYTRMTEYATTSTLRIGYSDYSASGYSDYWWLRSRGTSNSSGAYNVSSHGSNSSYSVTSTVYGLAPGFCLK